jgi:hypothetical protein
VDGDKHMNYYINEWRSGREESSLGSRCVMPNSKFLRIASSCHNSHDTGDENLVRLGLFCQLQGSDASFSSIEESRKESHINSCSDSCLAMDLWCPLALAAHVGGILSLFTPRTMDATASRGDSDASWSRLEAARSC